jgi:GT2 family glycosyltransferase
MAGGPHISVVIPPCNRLHDIHRCLISVAKVTYPTWDVRVIDQSSTEDTKALISGLLPELPGLQYCYLAEKNASRARNMGFALATGEIVAYLDDDCTVEADWLEQVAAVFARHPRAALVFGTVRAAEHNPQECLIPAYEAREERPLSRRWALGGVMGASMYLHRALVGRHALFDPYLGPGARPFSSSQDWDFAYRILWSGGLVVKTPGIVVRHYGSRDHRTGAAAQLVRSWAFSNGGITVKLLRCGDAAALLLLGAQLRLWVSRVQLRNLALLRRPNGGSGILWFLRGLFAGFRLRVNRADSLYMSKRRL